MAVQQGRIGGGGKVAQVSAPKKLFGVQRVPGAKKIRLRELPVFSRMVAAMLDSGIPLVQTLQALEEQTSSVSFRAVIRGIRGRIESGSELSKAMQDYPDVFDHTYVCMMRAGEAGGMLSEISARVAKYLEASAKLRSKVRSAMMYPIVVMTLALGIAFAMIIWLIPIFSDIYKDFGAALPGPTRVLVAISGFLRTRAPFVVFGVAALVYGILYLKKTPRGAYVWDQAILKFPLIGELAKKISLGRATSTFAQLIHSGVPILETLDIVAVASGNKVYERIFLQAKNTVESGDLLSSELRKHREFPKMLVHMLSAGERTGKMDDMLQKVSEFYEDEVSNALSGLTAVIEPILMVFLGVVVGGIVLGMFMPLFRMTDIMQF